MTAVEQTSKVATRTAGARKRMTAAWGFETAAGDRNGRMSR